MGTALFKIKIMPDAPDASLDAIETAATAVITKHEGKTPKIEREPVAFGLNAIITTFARDEEKDSDEMITDLQNIEHVSSAEIIDFRRAFG